MSFICRSLYCNRKIKSAVQESFEKYLICLLAHVGASQFLLVTKSKMNDFGLKSHVFFEL